MGVHIDSTLTWTKHIDYITKKATKRLYFLKVLKRAGLPSDHLLHYYTAVIRPVLEYCSCIWHHNIPNKLSLQVESIQKRAIKIIFETTRNMHYSSSLYYADLPSLQQRRDQQARNFFNQILQPKSSLHCLLPPPRDKSLIAKLRVPRKYPVLASRTKNINHLSTSLFSIISEFVHVFLLHAQAYALLFLCFIHVTFIVLCCIF